jgi:hypothetical protein
MEMLIGAGIAWASGLVGWMLGRRRPPRLRPPAVPVCGCTHHLSFHGHDGVCGAMREVPTKFDGYGDPIAFKEVVCGCRKYVLRDDPMAAVGGYDAFPLPPAEG